LPLQPLLIVSRGRAYRPVWACRSKSSICRVICLTLVCLTICGCGLGKHPFLMVQLCVEDSAGLSRLRQELDAIARDEHMHIGDTSAATRDSLDRIDNAFREESPDSPRNSSINVPAQLINIRVYGDDGLSLSAGNIGLSDYDIVIGFSEGDRAAASRQFSLRVINRLKRNWRVRTIPSGQGALPDPNCSTTNRTR
jgi:hypothetical protein